MNVVEGLGHQDGDRLRAALRRTLRALPLESYDVLLETRNQLISLLNKEEAEEEEVISMSKRTEEAPAQEVSQDA